MKICTSTGVLSGKYDEKTALKMLKEAGFDSADLNLCGMKDPENHWHGDDYKEKAPDLKAYAEEIGISIDQAHAPFGFGMEDFEGFHFPTVWRSIEIAALAGAKKIVVHPLQHLPYIGNEEELFRINMEYYPRFMPLCEKYGIQICTENMFQRSKLRGVIEHSTCSHREEFNRYVDTLKETCGEYIGACLDLGHMVLVGEDPIPMIKHMNKRITALHIHDNNYQQDMHTLPGNGKMEMVKIFEALKEVGYDGIFTLEADNFFLRQPAELWPLALKYMAQVSRHYAKIFED